MRLASARLNGQHRAAPTVGAVAAARCTSRRYRASSGIFYRIGDVLFLSYELLSSATRTAFLVAELPELASRPAKGDAKMSAFFTRASSTCIPDRPGRHTRDLLTRLPLHKGRRSALGWPSDVGVNLGCASAKRQPKEACYRIQRPRRPRTGAFAPLGNAQAPARTCFDCDSSP